VGRLGNASAETSITSWLEGASPHILALLAAANSSRCSLKAEASADGEAIHLAFQDCRSWANANPCPDPASGDRFEILLARYGLVALVCRSDSSETADGQLVDQLSILNAQLAAHFANLQERSKAQRAGNQ
jgi:hypothetical protein